MGGLVTLGIVVAGVATDQAEIARFRGDLAKVRSEFRSIHIEFKLMRTTPEQEFSGKLLMLRDQDRALYGLLEMVSTKTPAQKETWLLRGEDISELQHSTRTVVRHHSGKNEAFEYVADVIPGVWLLDATEGRKRCEVRMTKRDENYNYFVVQVNKPTAIEYRFAVMAREAGGFPRGAIRQVATLHSDGTQESWGITKWAIDADAKLSATDFPDPAKMDGWKLREWPGWKVFFEQLRKKSE